MRKKNFGITKNQAQRKKSFFFLKKKENEKKNVNDKQHQKRRPVNYYMRFTNISTVIIDKKKTATTMTYFVRKTEPVE